MMLFNYRNAGTATGELRDLTDLYKMIGLEAPNSYAETKALVTNIPDVHETVMDYAKRAFTDENPEALVKEAHAAIADAMAAHELRRKFLDIENTMLARNLTGMKNQFREDATKQFNTDIKAFTEAANRLDRNNPLDAELAVSQDNGKALTTVRELLPKLARYASMWVVSDPKASPQLRYILPILDVPVLVRERVHQTLTESTTTLNPEEAAGSLTVRRLDRDAHANVDRALLGIARGEYPGVSLNITTPTPNVGEAFMQDREVDRRSWV